jgi:hydroxymethylpyrimidine kinase/phosphomethylpyrimidine kinase
MLAPLIHIASVVTPNLAELAVLTGLRVLDEPSMQCAAERLRGLGARAVLAKGGHLAGDPVDLLVDDDGVVRQGAPRITLDEAQTPHGTGCALSTDLACRLAVGTPLREAARAATRRVRTRIAEARAVGRGRPFLG